MFVNSFSLSSKQANVLGVKQSCLFAAIADVLVTAAGDSEEVKVCVKHGKTLVKPHECEVHILEKDWHTVYDFIRTYKSLFTAPAGNGVPLLVYSVLLSKGIENIKKEVDIEGTKLTTEHGYAG